MWEPPADVLRGRIHQIEESLLNRAARSGGLGSRSPRLRVEQPRGAERPPSPAFAECLTGSRTAVCILPADDRSITENHSSAIIWLNYATSEQTTDWGAGLINVLFTQFVLAKLDRAYATS